MPAFCKIEEAVAESIKECQKKLKRYIIRARQLEINQLEKKKTETAIGFITFLAQALMIIKPSHKKADIMKALSSTMDNDEIKPHFCYFSNEEKSLLVTSKLFEVDDQTEANVNQEHTALLTADLLHAFKICVVTAITAYTDATETAKTLLRLSALTTTTALTKATETASAMVDNEPSVDTSLLNELIAKQVQHESAGLLKKLKNFKGGAMSQGASIKKKSTKNPNKKKVNFTEDSKKATNSAKKDTPKKKKQAYKHKEPTEKSNKKYWDKKEKQADAQMPDTKNEHGRRSNSKNASKKKRGNSNKNLKTKKRKLQK